MTVHRRPVYFNPAARSWAAESAPFAELVGNFHQNLEGYKKSPLVSVKSVAEEIGVRAVYVKDETNRFGLPTFLGTSWRTFRALTDRLDLPVDSGIEAVKARLSKQPISLYAATQGDHGRAVARVGALLAIPVEIHVPSDLIAETIALVEAEGATVVKSKGNYSAALLEAAAASQKENGILVQEELVLLPNSKEAKWIAEGCSTIMREIDDQVNGQQVNFVISPVEYGSLAQAAVTHFKATGKSTSFVAVEPDTAGHLWTKLSKDRKSIMPHINGNESSTADWGSLNFGADASLTISDYEAYLASLDLRKIGIVAGLSGASGLAALRRLGRSDKDRLGLDENSVVVILCTEGSKIATVPKNVASDDVVCLTQNLIQIDSSNPDSAGPGEGAIGRYITSWLQHRDIETHWIEPTAGRPSVVGVVRGSGGGKSLMFNGHIDTVTLAGYDGEPLSGQVDNGSIYGRGAADMKSGLAAAMVALVNAKCLSLRGDVILAAVSDEEMDSIGTEQVLEAGWRADAAIVAEPTEMAIVHMHKGYALFEVDIHGVAAHGSRADLGVDAICKAGYFLVELDRHARELQESCDRDNKRENGVGNIHCGVIKGGEEINSYPARCTISIERRTIAGETCETVKAQLLSILNKLAATVPGFKFDLRSTFDRSPFFIARDHPFLNLVVDHATECTGTTPTVRGEPYWTDMALLSDVGIPGLIWGPKGYGLHAKTEWVEIESIRQLTDSFVAIEAHFCK
jgi:acetylornithine deacetylase/succinyl-diaminopimelate desuccinylase family protein